MSYSSRAYHQYLQELGITDYQPRKPVSLQGKITLVFPTEIALLIVNNSTCHFDDSFTKDVLRSLNITPSQVTMITECDFFHLIHDIHIPVWIINPSSEYSTDNYPFPVIFSDHLSVVKQTPVLKKQLWHQICNYETYFSSY